MIDDLTVVCARCGVTRDAQVWTVEELAWTVERDGNAERWLCPSCTRTYVRDIETKLPSDRW